MSERYWEIDFLRGIAVIAMIIFHFLWDIDYFLAPMPGFTSLPVVIFARSIPALFMLIGGIALTLSYSRVKNLAKKEITKKYLKRGLKIFGYGLLITIFTFLFFREETILFGILHFFGIAIILSIPFLAGKWKNLALGAIIIAIGLQLWQMTFDFPWLMWLGLYPKGMWTFDYFPLLPWFGFILIGIFLGNTLYKDGKRIFKIKELGQKIIAKQLCWAGNHSLIIYFIHQPILVGIILAVKAMGIA